ncbi:MAG: prolipoprotein diacylglyceryl transferase [Opitutales bacterium]
MLNEFLRAQTFRPGAPTPPEPTPGYWVHEGTYEFLIRFPDGWFLPGIRWYGLAYLTGFLVAALLLRLYHKHDRSPLNPDQQANLMVAGILGVLVGGRLGFMFLYRPDLLRDDILNLFRVWEGGMASHGGFIGVGLAIAIFARLNQLSIYRLADIMASITPPGLFLGRIANFINGELWGKTTDVSWAVIFSRFDAETGMFIGYTEPRHPSQLYQAVLEGLIPALYLQWRMWQKGARKRPPGQLCGEFLILYAIARIIGEIFREPDAFLETKYHFGLLSRGQLLSVFLLIAGIGVIVRARLRARKSAPNETPA